MSAERTHFVYRVYDPFGILLYVGCTRVPEKRWAQHSGTTWRQYAARKRMEGPYEKRAAFKRESEVIESERPFFNSLRDHKKIQNERYQLSRRLWGDLHRTRPEIQGAVYGTPLWAEVERESARIEATIDATHPIVDNNWRHTNYLNERRSRVVTSA